MTLLLRARICVVAAGLCLAVASVWPPSTAAASELRETALVRAARRNAPAVVNIHGQKTVTTANASVGGATVRQVNGMGTGVLIDPRGYVLTNFHVVEGVRSIKVKTHRGKELTAKLIAHDLKTDLAVIKINQEIKFQTIHVGTSSDLMPGEPVIALGNPYGYSHTVSRGIISALHREVPISDKQKYRDLIQTDASINPGNSGGPLLNVDGEMIGIVVAVRVGAQGIGFAIPVDRALDVAADLMAGRHLGRSWHGVAGETKFEDRKPRFVLDSIRSGSPAETGGLRAGDIVTEVDGKKVSRAIDFETALLGRQPAEEVKISILRGGAAMKLSMVAAPLETPATAADDYWRVLGLRLTQIEEEDFRRYSTRYRGGLRVTGVRDGSPAARQGIRAGDVLVGMHVWETVSLQNVDYVLARPEFKRGASLKFYILRGNETLYGYLPLETQRR